MSTLTVTHPSAHIAPLSTRAIRRLVLGLNIAVIVVAPALLSLAILLRG